MIVLSTDIKTKIDCNIKLCLEFGFPGLTVNNEFISSQNIWFF